MNQKLEECHMVQLLHHRISNAVLLGHLHLHQSLNRSARAGLLTFSLINDLQISVYLYIYRLFTSSKKWSFYSKGEKADRGIAGLSVSPYRERILCIPVSPTDPLYPMYRQWILCIANGSSVSPMDPPYPRYIFYILIALSTSSVAITCSNCILNSSQILYCGIPLGLQVLYYRDTLGFSSTILWEYP